MPLLFKMSKYDVLLIGAGQSAIPLARELATHGKKVALVERKHLGGSCVNFGCTPTKAVIASARLAYHSQHAAELGINISHVEIDYPAVLARARKIVRATIQSLSDQLHECGVDIVEGHAKFDGKSGDLFKIRVGVATYLAQDVVIDTGTRTRLPQIDGLESVGWIDAGNWMTVEKLPASMLILGGGYVGIEMAQFYARMGVAVTVIDSGDQILSHEDADIANAIQTLLEQEKIEFRLKADVKSIKKHQMGIEMTLIVAEKKEHLSAQTVFVATGRQPNTDDLGLYTIGLQPREDGVIEVDDTLASSVSGVWAVGDVRGGPMFTHTSWDDHRVLEWQLMKIGERKSIAGRIIPYAVFTDPELGRVGMTERQARKEHGDHVRVQHYDMSSNGRANQAGQSAGQIKLVIDSRTDRLLGAAVLSASGAELVSIYIAMMNAGATMDVLKQAMFIHPTLAEAVQSAAM